MRKETVALYSMAGELRRHVSPAKEREMIAQDKAHWVCARCGRYSGKGRCLGAAQHAMIFRLTHLERADHESSAAITARETLANVGITSEKAGEVANRNTVRAAQTKIEAWPVTIDTKAPIFNSALAHLLRSRALAPTLAVLLLCFLAPLARGQNTATIQGKLVDGGGNAVTNSKVTFELSYCNGDATVAGGVIVQPLTLRYGSGIDSTGALSGSIYKNSVISCFGTVAATRWRMCKYVAGSSVRCDEYNITGATFDISTAVPIFIPSNAPLPSINLRDSTVIGPLSIAGGGSNNTSYTTNGGLYFDGSKFASTQPGGSGTFALCETNGGAPFFSNCSITGSGTPLTSNTSNPATTGQIRLANGDAINIRNQANSANLNLIGTDGSGNMFVGDVNGFFVSGTGMIRNANTSSSIALDSSSNIVLTTSSLGAIKLNPFSTGALGTQINTSVYNNGSGFKHSRFGATTATAAAAGATQNTTYAWTTGFADTSYTITCTGYGATNVPVIVGEGSRTTGGFTLTVAALTAAAASYSEVDCIAVHD